MLRNNRNEKIQSSTDRRNKGNKPHTEKQKHAQNNNTQMSDIVDLDEAHGKVYSREQCAKGNRVCVTTVVHTTSKFSEHGLKEALSSKRSVNSDNARRKLDGRAEAKIIEIAISPAPDGRARWTLRLLEKECRAVLEVSNPQTV